MMRRVCILLFILMKSLHAANIPNEQIVQRGAVFFMNYCSGCHALRYMRTKSVTGYQSLTNIALPEADARQWFGRMPPDLSLTARERGSTWLYTYLNGFYADQSRPFGANNTVIANTAMPDILYPLRGHVNLEADVHDVVSFLVYIAEPTRIIRYRTGLWVLLFSGFLGILIYRLKVMYWRDIQ